MKCPRCQHDGRPAAKFCEECGTPFTPPNQPGSDAASYDELQRALTDALDQQSASSQILQVVGRSTTSIQPVFDAVAESAARLCIALDRTVHILDLQVESDEFREGSEVARRMGHRTVLIVPLMRGGTAIGTIGVRRAEARLFTERQVALLEKFADQAVIAIENVRLFKELESKNRDLTTALDKQTATSDILRVISRSQTDVQPVFDAILASAVRLLWAHHGALTRVVGDEIELTASTFTKGAEDPALRAAAAEGSHAQVIRERAPVNIADMQTDPLPGGNRSQV